jgi:hypothetical protein
LRDFSHLAEIPFRNFGELRHVRAPKALIVKLFAERYDTTLVLRNARLDTGDANVPGRRRGPQGPHSTLSGRSYAIEADIGAFAERPGADDDLELTSWIN